ncbi:MAG: Asp-tRNA(Asn)/Glu-tRNA(Gln) amidotransferase subunit GatA [Patescibacteria group bacterium]
MLHELTIHEAHEGLTKKKFSSKELAKAFLDRIKKVDPGINSYVLVRNEKEVLAEAEKADSSFTGKSNPLHGVPCSLKDVFCTEGVRTTACSKMLENFVPPYDATSVRLLKKAGMVLLGKTNTDEFTCGGSTETSIFGVTKTPWDTERVAGGSSGGSAAAVSASLSTYSMGTDTGGSIRQPASFCSITGLKVTYGRVSRSGVLSMASSLDTVGPMAKDVHDIALIMNVIAGSDPKDSTMPNVPVPDYTKSLQGTDLSGLTVGVPDEYFIDGMDPDVEKKVREAIADLEKLGAKVKKISLPHTKYANAVYYVICPSEVSANMARYDRVRFGPALTREADDLLDYYLTARTDFGDEMKRRIMVGTYALSAGYYDAYYLKAQKVRTLIKQDFEKAFEDVDFICTPVSPTPPFKIAENTSDPLKMYLADIFTISANLAGICGLALPCGFSSTNLPIGMQLLGAQFDEPTLIRAGHAYQQSTDWHLKKPTI